MSSRQACHGPPLRLFLWIAAVCLLFISLLAFFYNPLIINNVIIPHADPARNGWEVFQFDNVLAKGRPLKEYNHSQPSVANPHSHSAQAAFTVFEAPEPGAYRFHLTSDDFASVYIDGRMIINQPASPHANHISAAEMDLSQGPHLVTVHAFNLQSQGSFELLVRGPGQEELTALAGDASHPPDLGNLLLWWRTGLFFAGLSLPLLAGLALLGLMLTAFAASRDLKQGLINSLVILVSLGLALGVGELAARLILPAPQMVYMLKTHDHEKRQSAERRENLQLEDESRNHHFYINTETGIRLKANATVLVKNHWLSKQRVTNSTNSLGYRNRELGPKKGLRILFLGDSITMGDYLHEPETFVRQTETLARNEGLKWETINTGISGISLKNQVAILNETGLGTDPDVVVLGFYLNDFQASPGVTTPRLPGLLNHSWLAHHLAKLSPDYRNPVRKVPLKDDEWRVRFTEDLQHWSKQFQARAQKDQHHPARAAHNQAIAENFWDWGGAWSPQVWRSMEPYFMELKRLSDKHGFQLLFMIFPVRQQVEAGFLDTFPQDQFKMLASKLGVPVLDFLPLLRDAHRRSEKALFYDHCHHTPHGNRLLAEKILEYLKRHAP